MRSTKSEEGNRQISICLHNVAFALFTYHISIKPVKSKYPKTVFAREPAAVEHDRSPQTMTMARQGLDDVRRISSLWRDNQSPYH
jgi:hypothetical protein